MMDTLDGEYQRYSIETGAYIREHFFGPDPRLRTIVEDLSDADLENLRRGGHDYRKLYAAYKVATETEGVPTVILAKTVKGWTLGKGVEARNVTHQAKKLEEDELKKFRDRLQLLRNTRTSHSSRRQQQCRSNKFQHYFTKLPLLTSISIYNAVPNA